MGLANLPLAEDSRYRKRGPKRLRWTPKRVAGKGMFDVVQRDKATARKCRQKDAKGSPNGTAKGTPKDHQRKPQRRRQRTTKEPPMGHQEDARKPPRRSLVSGAEDCPVRGLSWAH